MALSHIHLIFIDDEHNTDDDCGKCGSMGTGRDRERDKRGVERVRVFTTSVVLIQQRIVSTPVTRKPAETFTRYVNNHFFTCTRAILTIEFGY